jgi:flagellar hook-basal body complex protein FliE
LDAIRNNLGGVSGAGGLGAGSLTVAPGAGTTTTSGASFSDMLQKSIGEVSQMQQDASNAVEQLSLGKTDDMAGVMVAMEKSDAAFKTLLAIRSKLMDAYDEVKNLPM